MFLLPENQLVASVVDIFLAGTDTTATFFMWGILLLGKHASIQTELAAEIDSVLESMKPGEKLGLRDIKR